FIPLRGLSMRRIEMHTLSQYTGRFLALLALSGLIGWGAFRVANPVHSVAQAQTDATKEALATARAKLDQARAEKRTHPSKETAMAVEHALAAYHAAVAARVRVLQARV